MKKKNPPTKFGILARAWLLIPTLLYALLTEVRKAARVRWPSRHIRPAFSVQMTDDMRRRPKALCDHLRQAGYTNGDQVVVMLESDFQRVANLAHKKQAQGLSQMLATLTASSPRIPCPKEIDL